MRYVKAFIDGKKERWEFDLDFDFELMNRYDDMCAEDEDYAWYFNFRIAESGVYAGDDLPDDEYKELIADQYYQVKETAAEGFY
jgi:hypothetical protein